MNDELIARLRAGHVPAGAALDQTGGPDGRICTGHGWGYPPPWPCLQVEAADALEAAQREATENRIRRQIIDTAYKQIKGLEAERDAEAALADGLAASARHAVAMNRPDHPPWKLYNAVDAMRPALAAHRERRTTPTKDGDQ